MSLALRTGAVVRKTADTLERGDVFEIDHRVGWIVCIEPSDHVSTAPPDHVFELSLHRSAPRPIPARDCCEPRVGRLGETGRLTHEVTYVVFPNRERFDVVAHLDLDVYGAVPVPLDEHEERPDERQE